MTNKEAIENFKGQIKCYKCETGIDCEKCRPNWSSKNDIEALEKGIEALENQKTGHWIRFKEFEDGYYHIKCSECGKYWSIDGHSKIFKYCFNCGARMESEATVDVNNLIITELEKIKAELNDYHLVDTGERTPEVTFEIGKQLAIKVIDEYIAELKGESDANNKTD